MRSKTVLITGVAGYWGSQLAHRLVTEPQVSVIGIDVDEPTPHIIGLDFIQSDIQNPALPELLIAEGVDTVCHLKFTMSVRPTQRSFHANVVGAEKLLEACAAAAVKKVVVKSSTAVYGAHPDNSAFLPENQSLRGDRGYGHIRDFLEIEALCEAYRHTTPEITLAIVRFANILGPSVDTPLARFLTSAWAPVLLGFDPVQQIVHADDVIEALALVILKDVPGTVNVAAEGVLPLSQMLALAGKTYIPIPHPIACWSAGILERLAADRDGFLPIPLAYLRYTCVGDLSKMHGLLGFEPKFTPKQALCDFAAWNRLCPKGSSSDILGLDEDRLRRTIRLRLGTRDRPAGRPVNGEVDGQ